MIRINLHDIKPIIHYIIYRYIKLIVAARTLPIGKENTSRNISYDKIVGTHNKTDRNGNIIGSITFERLDEKYIPHIDDVVDNIFYSALKSDESYESNMFEQRKAELIRYSVERDKAKRHIGTRHVSLNDIVSRFIIFDEKMSPKGKDGEMMYHMIVASIFISQKLFLNASAWQSGDKISNSTTSYIQTMVGRQNTSSKGDKKIPMSTVVFLFIGLLAVIIMLTISLTNRSRNKKYKQTLKQELALRGVRS